MSCAQENPSPLLPKCHRHEQLVIDGAAEYFTEKEDQPPFLKALSACMERGTTTTLAQSCLGWIGAG
jgi:hypothetical protein